MSENLEEFSRRLLSVLSEKTFMKIKLKGYVPPSKNSLKGSHWSVLHREKTRAAYALLSALESNRSGRVIGTIAGPNAYKISYEPLVQYMTTHGMFSKDLSSLKRHTKKKKKKLK